MSTTTQPADLSTAELLSRLSTQTSRLVRDEVKLAQKELQQSARHAGVGAGLLGIAGLLAFLGLAVMAGAGIAALALVIPVWAAALVVSAVLFAAAGLAALASKRRAEQVPPPAAESVDSVRRDVDQIKDEIKEARR